MTRYFSLFLVMNNSESNLKQEMMVEEMEDLMEDQVSEVVSAGLEDNRQCIINHLGEAVSVG